MLVYLLMIAASFTHLSEGILIKQYNKKHSNGGFVFTAIVSVFGLIFVLASELIKGNALDFTLSILPYGIIAGILYCSASVFTYIALQHGSFAITQLVLSYSLVISIIYGLLFLKEDANVFTYIGFVLIAASIFLVRGKSESNAADKNTNTNKFSFLWVVAMIISVLGCGMFGVIQKMQQLRFEKALDSEFMIITYAISALTLLVVGFIKDGYKHCFSVFKTGTLYAGSAGLTNGATNMLGMLINTMIPISIATPTRSAIKTVISFLFSLLVFKEHFEKRQIIGVILGAAAVVLLNL